jgi:biopolymer transport protein ExbB/TolQ
MGASFLSVVPLVVTIYPGLLAGFYAWSKRKEKLSNREKETAVADAVARANEAAAKKAKATSERAKQNQDKAVEQAVKQALAEASKKEEPK